MLVLSCFLCFIISYLAENTETVATKNGASQTFKMPVDCLLSTVSDSILRCFWVHREQNSLLVYVYACAQLFLMPHNRLPRREHRNSGNKGWP